MALFDSARFRALAFEHRIAPDDADAHLHLFARLTARASNGTLRVLSETRIEQSFNEQLFTRIFGYSTLFSHGGGEYDLLPKNFTSATTRYDDFSLGFFGPPPRSGVARVSAELKSPGTDLDARPAPNRPSPVEQAHTGAPPTARWVIVSNFDELRLYRAGNRTDFERVRLVDVVEPYALDHMMALFSKHSLLGEDGALSALDRLHAGGPPFMLPPRQGFIRIVHEVRSVRPPEHPLPLATLEDALQHAMAAMPDFVWPRRIGDWSVRLRDDRLVVETVENNVALMLMEVTRSGVLRLSEYPTVDPSTPTVVSGEEVACRAASFWVLSARLIDKLGLGTAEVKWSLLDVANAAVTAPASWVSGNFAMGAFFPADVPSTHTPPFALSVAAPRGGIVALAVRELLFPCELRAPFAAGGGRVRRLAPSAQVIDVMLAANPSVPRGAIQDAAGQFHI